MCKDQPPPALVLTSLCRISARGESCTEIWGFLPNTPSHSVLTKPKGHGKTWNCSSVVLPPLKSNWPLTSALQDQDSYLLPHNQSRALLLGDGAIPSGKFSLPLFNEEHEKGMVVSLTYNFHASVRLCQCCQARNYCPLLIMNRV